MKTLKYIVIALCFSMGLGACNSLDLSPEDYYGSSNFWNNEAQVNGFVIGAHNDLRSAGFTYFLLGEARGGLQKHGVSSTSTSIDYSSPIKDQDFTKDKAGISSWGGFYSRILNLNLGIDKLENETAFLSNETRSYYLGQLYGLRAFYYFWLYRTYGGVPLATDTKILDGIKTAEPLYLERSTPKETLDFIKSDVEKSLQSFGSNNSIGQNKGLWSRFASLMLKAEIYLWSAKVSTGDQTPGVEDLTQAENALNQVKGQFSLVPEFKNVFHYNQKGNPEIIMALRYLDNEATNNVGSFLYSDNVFIGIKYSKQGLVMGDTLQLKGNGLLRNEYYFDFFESYNASDSRKEATFLDFYDKNSEGAVVDGGTVLKKFLGIINSNGNRVYADDIPLYRYADALLMLAEVENKKGGNPAIYINEIRQRAYGDHYKPNLHGYVNQDFQSNEIAILNERDKEFVFENKRWFDVLRLQDATGKPLAFSTALTYGLVPVLKVGEEHKVLWPVDVNTLNNDPKLEQTPGYN